MISSLPKWVGNLFDGYLRPNMTVTNIESLSPSVKKIRFEGNLTKMNFQVGYANVIRVTDTDYRNYTVSNYNSDEGNLEIIFHIHGNGAGCDYIDTLNPGDKIFLSSARGHKVYDSNVKSYFFFGDETGFGLATALMNAINNNTHQQVQFYFELEHSNMDIPGILGLKNYTVFPKGSIFSNKTLISELPVFQNEDWQQANYILTGNVSSVQSFRSVLKQQKFGNKIHSQGYWIKGKKGL